MAFWKPPATSATGTGAKPGKKSPKASSDSSTTDGLTSLIRLGGGDLNGSRAHERLDHPIGRCCSGPRDHRVVQGDAADQGERARGRDMLEPRAHQIDLRQRLLPQRRLQILAAQLVQRRVDHGVDLPGLLPELGELRVIGDVAVGVTAAPADRHDLVPAVSHQRLDRARPSSPAARTMRIFMLVTIVTPGTQRRVNIPPPQHAERMNGLCAAVTEWSAAAPAGL